MDHDNCPLTFFKALLNIIGEKGALSNINYYYCYYYYHDSYQLQNNACLTLSIERVHLHRPIYVQDIPKMFSFITFMMTHRYTYLQVKWCQFHDVHVYNKKKTIDCIIDTFSDMHFLCCCTQCNELEIQVKHSLKSLFSCRDHACTLQRDHLIEMIQIFMATDIFIDYSIIVLHNSYSPSYIVNDMVIDLR